MTVIFCELPKCSHQFNHSRHWHPYCSEYCHRIHEEKIPVKNRWPVLTRLCNWCHGEHPMNWNHEAAGQYFCGRECAHAAQGLRKYYCLMLILKLNPQGLTTNDIAPMGDQHGVHMNSQKAGMRLRSLVARQLVVYEEVTTSTYPQRLYSLNPAIAHLPFQESMKVLDTHRKTHRRDKIRNQSTATKTNTT